MKTIVIAALLSWFVTSAFADPQLTSWLTNYSGQYARVYTTVAHRSSGTSTTLWTNNLTLPSYADVDTIMYSSSSIYVRYSDLASYIMGPWTNPNGGVFMFWPTNAHAIAKFPRNPSGKTGTKTITGTGYSG